MLVTALHRRQNHTGGASGPFLRDSLAQAWYPSGGGLNISGLDIQSGDVIVVMVADETQQWNSGDNLSVDGNATTKQYYYDWTGFYNWTASLHTYVASGGEASITAATVSTEKFSVVVAVLAGVSGTVTNKASAVETTTPGSASSYGNPPSITGVSETSLVIAVEGNHWRGVASQTPPTGYTLIGHARYSSSSDLGSCSMAYKLSPSSTENPSAFDGYALGSWWAATLEFEAA